jgi:hypothetical protein
VLAILWELLRGKESEPTQQPIKDHTAAAHASIGDIHINVPVSTNPTKTLAAEIAPPRIKSVVKPKRQKLVFGPIRYEYVTIGLHGEHLKAFEIDEIQDGSSGELALLLPVYNDPNQSEADVEYARAHIVFTDQLTKEQIIVPYAWWIGEYLEEAHLPIGAHRFVVVVLADKGEERVVLENTVRRDLGTRYEFNKQILKEHSLTGAHYQVQVTVIYGGNSQLKDAHTFEYHAADMS